MVLRSGLEPLTPRLFKIPKDILNKTGSLTIEIPKHIMKNDTYIRILTYN